MAVGVLLAVEIGLTPAGAQADVVVPPFDGSAAAYGTRVTEVVPSAPIADTILDGGGPTAQAGLGSLGDGTGYAALPDPGAFLVGAPDLVAGLLTINTTLPSYPLVVTADATTPHKKLAAAVYDIDAQHSDTSSSATAQVGVGLGVNVALVKSNASVSVQKDGSVIATATSDVEGLTLGPLSLGQVETTATRTLKPDGTITSKSDIHVDGLRIGGLQVPIPIDALNGVGTGALPVPLSLGPVLDALLAPLGISIETMSAQQTGDTVTAPALILTGTIPLETLHLKLGTGDGTYRLALGESSARLVGSAAPPAYTPPPTSGPSGGSHPVQGSGPVASSGGGSSIGNSQAGSSIGSGTSSGATNGGTSSTQVSGGSLPPASPMPPLRAVLASMSGAFGVADIYLILAGAAVMAFAIAQLVRVMGVRTPWTSIDG
jgi:hypothetical protein